MHDMKPLIPSSSGNGLRSIFSALIVGALLLPLSGCSTVFDFINGTRDGDAPPRPKRSSSDAPIKSDVKRHGLQVTWQVPSEAVDGFIVRFGERPDSLKQEKRVPIDSLKQDDDPEFGPVYRYTIADIPADSSLYVSVAAYKGDRLSEFSQVMKDSSR
jgi:hypothetical protein